MTIRKILEKLVKKYIPLDGVYAIGDIDQAEAEIKRVVDNLISELGYEILYRFQSYHLLWTIRDTEGND